MKPQGRERQARRKLRMHSRVFLVLVGVVLLIAAIRLWQPFSGSRRQQEEIARLRAEKAQLQAEQAELQTYKHDLASDRGQEGALRRQGYTKPGDRPLVFVRKKPAEKKGK